MNKKLLISAISITAFFSCKDKQADQTHEMQSSGNPSITDSQSIAMEPSTKQPESYLSDSQTGLTQAEQVADAQVGARSFTDSTPDSPSIPMDVRHFLERSKNCNHWGGEEGYDAERQAEIEKAITELHCSSLDSEKAKLMKTHEKSPQIIDSINSADTLTW